MTPSSPPPSASVVLCVRDALDAVPAVAARVAAVAALRRVDVVVVDDGSTDGTGEALARLLPRRVDVTLVRHPESAGVAARRNEALAWARGEHVWFVDHDDEWTAGDLMTLRGAAAGADVVVAGADYRWGPGAGERRRVDGARVDGPTEVDGARASAMLVEGAFHGFLWSKLFRREALGAAPFPALPAQSDIVGVATALAAAETVRLLPDTVYTYVRTPGSITRRTPDASALERAHDLVLASAGRHASADARDAFTARFLCLAAVKTAVRWRAGRAAVREAVAVAARRAREVRLARLLRRSPALGAVVLLLRACPPALPPLLRTALHGLDLLRTARGAARRATRRAS
ncbi:glycosyltransferase [Leifsonia sp. F6_8S_P_1B]|uniref:Glycosyltransferase n=1 Tax=Leifsonia williamsii TaxID=3035919 RepID=A0ABT8KCP9_9MICO|nr:glycosyltransferase [Leifsonia williamsii]MDN4614536.1 glycosyltransferase [Leifsonia williamsii]